ncbi:MAG: hypothetical protein EBQ80_03315 [Proteobacteria bacterium]|nr:hypothetical protein [Pseudomonadota bacterium]
MELLGLPWFDWLLVPVVFFTAILTAVSGAGGGVLLLGIMGLVLPVAVVVPVHGAVMVPPNFFRAYLLLRHVDWRFVGIGTLGSVVGALLVAPFAVWMPPQLMHLLLGLGLLFLVWAPKGRLDFDFPGKVLVLALVTSVVSMLIGAAGILLSAVRRREGRDKEAVLADQSVLMLVQHSLKAGLLGIMVGSLAPYWTLIAVMAVVGMAGTWVGVNWLRKMDLAWFDKVFKTVVSVVALVQLWQAWHLLVF